MSFQTTANEKGELVKKPLINLHVTPNGCGILGCEEEGLENYGGQYPPLPDQGYYPGGPAKSQGFLAQQGEKIANFFSPKKHHAGGQVPNYGPPPPVYNDGYKAPPAYHNEVPPVYHGDYKAPGRTQQPSYNPPPPPPAYNPPPQQGYNQPQPRPVKFNHQEPVVVKHEHHHYYHESQGGNNNEYNNRDQGIKFGFNGNGNGNGNNPNNFHNNFNNGFGNQEFLGRTNNQSEIEANQDQDQVAEFVDNNNVKRQSSLVSFGTPEQVVDSEKPKEKMSSGAKESGFKFPAARSLNSQERRRRSPDKETEEETEEEIQAVKFQLNFAHAQKSQTKQKERQE